MNTKGTKLSGKNQNRRQEVPLEIKLQLKNNHFSVDQHIVNQQYG